MVRKYKRSPGSRPYANFTVENLEKALADIKKGVSQAEASRRYKISRSTLHNKLFGKHQGDPGHPTTLSPEDEQAISGALSQVADWGFPLTSHDVAQLVAKYVQKQGRTIKEWKNNCPGPDFVENFVSRNNLSTRLATNIKRSRSSVSDEDISEFFNNVKDVLKDADPHHVFNYDETNITDDPGAKKVLVPRGTKRIERVQEHSRAAVSIMICGSAAGTLLPPMVVYKALNVYENWTKGGPAGAIYNHSCSGWFDMNLFEQWFFKILLPHVQKMKSDKVKIVIGDNLASHFSPAVIKASQENNIYMTPLPPNSTHIMQPLDVSVFAPMKRKWRQILDDWRKASRTKGTIPKEQFPLLLNRLWNGINPTVDTNLKSGFRTTGIHPFDPQTGLSKLPTTSAANTPGPHTPTSSVLSDSVLEYLQEARGSGLKTAKKKRGKKILPGMRMVDDIQGTADIPESLSKSPSIDIQPRQVDLTSLEECLASTSGISKSRPNKSKKGKGKAPKRKKKALESRYENFSNTEEEIICKTCAVEWEDDQGPDWIKCVLCNKWVCGMCNKGSTNPQYMCEECEDDD